MRNQFYPPEYEECFRRRHNNTDVYRTVFVYDSKQPSTAKKIGDLYFDLDTNDCSEEGFDTVREDAQRIVGYMHSIMHVPYEDMRLYFSGARGIHILVPYQVFGITEPVEDLHLMYRVIAGDVLETLPHQTLDMQIYDCRRLFRLPNSINSKTGCYKVPLTWSELWQASYKRISALARRPRALEPRPPTYCPDAAAAWKYQLRRYRERPQTTFRRGEYRPLEDAPPCVRTLLASVVPEGSRNNSMIAVASYLSQNGWGVEEIYSCLMDWNERYFDPPFAERDVADIARRAYERIYGYGCAAFKVLSECKPHECSVKKSIYKRK